MPTARTAKLGRLLCLGGAALGMLGILGWITGTAWLTTLVPGEPPMRLNTAVALSLVGVAGALRHPTEGGAWRRVVARFLAVIVLGIGVATLTEYALGVDLHIDQLLGHDAAGPYPGRSSPPTALALTLLGATLLLFDLRPMARARPSEWLTLSAALIAFTALIGQLLGAGTLYRLARGSVVGVAVPTALSLLVTSLGLLLERPAAGIMRVVTASGPGSTLIRRLALLAGLAPALLGIVVTRLFAAFGVDDFALAAAALSASMAAVSLILLFVTAVPFNRAQDALHRSQQRTRDLVELAPDAFFLADLDARLVDVNQAACRMLGYAREELVGKTILDIIPPEDAPRLAAVRAELLVPGQVNRGEWTQKHKDGTLIPVEVSSNIISDGRWQAFVRDISERKRIEDERQIFVALLENSSDFIGIADPSGKPVYVNPAGRRMVGLPADLPVEQTAIPDYYPPAERAFASEVIVKSMVDRGHWSGETYFRNWRTEEPIPVSDDHFMIRDPASGRVLGMGTITRDISEARRLAREREELLARELQARERAEAANEDLRKAEERFRLTIDEAPIGMALVALDGRLLRVNRVLCQILGYTEDELTGLTFQAITHPADLDADLALAGQLARGEIPRYQLEKRYLRKDGTTVECMISGSVLRDRAGAPIHYIAQIEDISERKRLADELRLSEAKASGILATSADAIISIDKDQRITLFNDGAEKIFGYSEEEAIGAPLDILIPERLRAIHRQHVERFAEGGEASRRMGNRGTVILALRKNGEEFPADAAISKLGVDGTRILTVALRDVTEQKRIESDQRFLAEVGAALATTLDYEETLTTIARQVVRALADFCIVDVLEEDGELQRIRVVGRDASKEWVCDSLRQFRIDPSRPHLSSSALRTKKPALIEELTPEIVASWAQSDEQLRVLQRLEARSLMVLPLLAHGKVLGALKFVSSTNPRAYGQADLRLAENLALRAALAIENARLYRAAERAIQARDEVLGVVAHDLRNPLGAIAMQAALLRRRGAEPERRSGKPVEVIERAAKRMERLIKDLLDITRIDAGRLSIEQARVSAAGLVSALVAAQEALASSLALELRLDLAPDLGEIFADRDRVAQALENLVGNAVKFSRPGGLITVGAAPRDGEVLFWVADTGAGIEASDVAHIFDRFWQAKKGGKQGAGLGLSIVKGIVEAHGGRIWVESKVGEGSTFFFTMPRARPETQATGTSSPTSVANQVATPEHPAVELWQPARVVLVAEDDPDVRDALSEMLQHAGYKVVAAANGAEALEYLHREAPPFLVIMDLKMPVMDGWAFLTERNRDPDLRSIPVIVVSGERGVEDRIAAAHASYVQKPILADRLMETMEHVVH